ncbi:MAG: SPOR domain-containing protein [Pseudomonadota bacterium]
MRNLLLILILANVLYFLWGNFKGEPREPGVAVIEQSDLGPPLIVAEPEEDEVQLADAGDVALDGDAADAADADGGDEAEGDGEAVPAAPERRERTELSAVVGRTCVTIGPFRAMADADSAQAQYSGEGMRTAKRQENGEIFVGHWVQIRDIATREEGNATVETLRDGGIPEAYLVTTDDEGLKISLGLFGNLEGAERVEQQARSLDLPAEISRRMSDGVFHFVDVALPPGRGAGAMIERYGEEKVKMRGEASCPD